MSHITLTNTVSSVAGRTGSVSLVKGDVGLGNVDNTSDANKPVSTAAATAIAAVTQVREAPLSPFRRGAVGDGSTDDTAAIQATINDAVAAKGEVYFPAVAGWKITDTITIQPASGAQCSLRAKANGTFGAFRYSGASNKPVFRMLGVKGSSFEGFKVTVADSAAGVSCFDIDTTSSYGSTSSVSFYDCAILLGAGVGNVGWRMGHVSGGGADISFYQWFNCIVVGGNEVAPVSGQVGWLNEGSNTLNNSWFGGAGICLAAAHSNKATAGATAVRGNGAQYFYGFGGSHNAIEFQLSSVETYVISGGRFEVGKRFLDVEEAAYHPSFYLSGVEIDEFTPSDEIIFNMNCPGTLMLDACRIYRVSSDHTSAAFKLGGFGATGTLHIRGGAMRTADPFYSLGFDGATWTVYVTGVGKLNSSQLTTSLLTARP